MSCSTARHEIFQGYQVRRDLLELGEENLQGALKELHLALDAEKVAVVDGAKLLLVGVPEPSADGPRPVSQFELDEEIALAIGA